MSLEVVDTNVWAVANGQHPEATQQCVHECITFLFDRNKKFVFDSDFKILTEYRSVMPIGSTMNRFLNEIQKNPARVEWVDLEKTDPPNEQKDGDWYSVLPNSDDLFTFDKSDRKFLAAALAIALRQIPVSLVNASDSDWCEIVNFLAANNITFKDLCELCNSSI